MKKHNQNAIIIILFALLSLLLMRSSPFIGLILFLGAAALWIDHNEPKTPTT
jgi:hypothetical protein